MQLKKLFHYAKKVYHLGSVESFKVLHNRFEQKKNSKKLRLLAQTKQANYTWEMIVKKHKLEQSFPIFLQRLKKNCDSFFPETILQPFKQDPDIEKKADQFVQNRFDLLGSGSTWFPSIRASRTTQGKLAFSPEPVEGSTTNGGIDWHVDFRLRNQGADYTFDKNRFYQDLEFSDCKTDQLAKDIKLPWELSRCYHFAVLGESYRRTQRKKYADTFYSHTHDWIEKNPVMLGPNWMCPMDVAIRAINWVVGFYYFRAESKELILSLYDHFVHLENNWEIFDSRTSNHYLSDLVGYFFLCFFFQELSGVEEKKQWCFTEILREFDKQVFDEGADYEGSTAYHCLVTELFYLFFELCKKNNMPLPKKFEKKLERMLAFINCLTPENGTDIIKIGDDDSGKILYHFPVFKTEKQTGQKTFSQFGLSVIKTKKWHITVRHHAYLSKQPSGHFHNDVGSITLAVDGIPVFVDPGSFVYTPSAVWRNRFRSVQAHNTFYIKDHEPVLFEDFLFTLGLPDNKMSPQEEPMILKTEHNLYKRFGLSAQRRVALDEEKNNVTISDAWFGKPNSSSLTSCHNFTLAPGIEPVLRNNDWHFLYNKKTIVRMRSEDLQFKIYDSWFSPGYGKKVPTFCLRAENFLKVEKKITAKIF